MTDFEATSDELRKARREYAKAELTEDNVAPDPFTQFNAWLTEAQDSEEIDEAYAMTVATVDPDGTPSARIVLLRGFDERGLTFFTNYRSAKGDALDHNPAIAAVFYWGPLERQVRFKGSAVKVDAVESNEYFASRPYKSKLGALVSEQSAVIEDRSVLENELGALQEQYPEGSDVPRPAHWGGYRIEPTEVEFWNGRRSRLHDRLRYRRDGESWTLERLAP